MDRVSQSSDLQHVNLLGFCQQVGRNYLASIREHKIDLQIEGDAALWQWLPVQRVRPILESLIEDAIAAMPDGGELDLTVIPVAAGVEIEVADSRDVDTGRLPAAPTLASMLQAESTADVPVAEPESGLEVETLACPQGGLARTLNIQSYRNGSPQVESAPLRRAA